MKQVTIENSTGEVVIVDAPSPDTPEGGVLVRVETSVLSAGTERVKLETGAKSLIGKARSRPDQVRQVVEAVRRDGITETYRFVRGKLGELSPIGYSLSGEVLAVGPLGGNFRPGDRVACAGAQHAFHATHVAVPRNLTCRVPDAVSDEAAAYATIGAIAMQGVRKSEMSLGEVVAVIGLGLVGQLAMQLVAAAGGTALGTDLDARKGELAATLSGGQASTDGEEFAELVDKVSRGRGADAILICAATQSDQPVAFAARLARDRGRVIVVGDVGLRLARAPFYDKELELRLSRSYGPGRYDSSYEEAGVDYPIGYVRWTEGRNLEGFLDLCAKGLINPAALTTHRFPLEEAASAYAALKSPDLALGVTLQYPRHVRHDSTAVSSSQPGRVVTDSPRVGFVGAGNFAVRTLIPAFKAADAQLVAICSEKGLSSRAVASRFSFNSPVSSIDAVIDSDVDVVVVASRHNMHGPHVLKAAQSGKHVFCEKPLCLTEDELAEIELVVAQSGVVCFVGFNRRFAPLVTAMSAHLASVPGPRDIVIRVNAGELRGHWLTDPQIGGGRWVGEGCHFVDLAIALSHSTPTFVTATAVGGSPREAGGMHAVYEFADGSTASIIYCDTGDPKAGKELIEVHGGGRSAILDDFRSLVLHAAGNKKVIRARGQDKGHNAEVRAFLSRLKNGVGGFTEDEVVSMRSTFSALDAAAVGGRVRIADHAREGS